MSNSIVRSARCITFPLSIAYPLASLTDDHNVRTHPLEKQAFAQPLKAPIDEAVFHTEFADCRQRFPC